MNTIFHDGQLAVQKIANEEEIAIQRLPMIKESLHPRFIPFIEHQILAFIGTEDVDGALWLSLLVGERGFIKIPSEQEIKFDLTKVNSSKNDIFFKNIIAKPTVGMLFHEAARRARYRAWGQANIGDNEISFSIKMGYPSCPKHIQREVIEVAESNDTSETSYEKGIALEASHIDCIANAHTFFIATQTKKGDIEASHRGGDPGFIEILENGHLRVPDYLGNSMFSTLGNIYENPKAALLFTDYEKGETLQLSGTAALQFDQNSEADYYTSGETGRFWTFETKQWIRTRNHHAVRTEFIDYSPFNVLTKK